LLLRMRLRSSLRQRGRIFLSAYPAPIPHPAFAGLENVLGYYLPRLPALVRRERQLCGNFRTNFRERHGDTEQSEG